MGRIIRRRDENIDFCCKSDQILAKATALGNHPFNFIFPFLCRNQVAIERTESKKSVHCDVLSFMACFGRSGHKKRHFLRKLQTLAKPTALQKNQCDSIFLPTYSTWVVIERTET